MILSVDGRCPGFIIRLAIGFGRDIAPLKCY